MIDRDYFPKPGCFGICQIIVLFVILALASISCGIMNDPALITTVNKTQPNLQLTDETKIQPTNAPLVYVVTADILNVREQPTETSRVIGNVYKGQALTPLVLQPAQATRECIGGWLPVEAGDLSGFVCVDYIVRK